MQLLKKIPQFSSFEIIRNVKMKTRANTHCLDYRDYDIRYIINNSNVIHI